MVVTPEDLTRDQRYHIRARRFWTALRYGWGIVRGLEVRLLGPEESRDAPLARRARVERGVLLDPEGREVVLDEAVQVDLEHLDADGHCPVLRGGPAPAIDPVAAAPRPDGACYLLTLRYVERPDRYIPSALGPRPDGSQALEPTVFRDGFAFDLVPWTPDAPDVEAEGGAVALGRVVDFGLSTMALTPEGRPYARAGDEPGGLVHALAHADLDRASAGLARWKADLRVALQRLLDPEGLERLRRLGPRGDLAELPARHLRDDPSPAPGWPALVEFFRRAESPHRPRHPLSVSCLARLEREEFRDRVRYIFRPDEISDRAIDHAHRAAALLWAVAPQWPAPAFPDLRGPGPEGRHTPDHHHHPRRP
jgi:hypothetical protein